MNRRPRIGVTGPDRGGMAAWLFTASAIWAAGGIPKRITPRHPNTEASPLDGLVLGGGADVDPALYGEAPATLSSVLEAVQGSVHRGRAPWLSILAAPGVHIARRLASSLRTPVPDRRRDALEERMFRRAVQHRLPILGICRGAQIVNVCRGGTLHGDIREFYVEASHPRTLLPRKQIELVEFSHLAKVLGANQCSVNALHHQAIRELGTDLAVVAREANGIVQAIEDPSQPFLIGVQWHPEYMPQDPHQRALFRALVDAARPANAR